MRTPCLYLLCSFSPGVLRLLLCYQALNFCSFDVYSKALSGVMSDGSNSARFLAGAMAGVRGSGARALWGFVDRSPALCVACCEHGVQQPAAVANKLQLAGQNGLGLQGARSWLGYNQQATQNPSPVVSHITAILSL